MTSQRNRLLAAAAVSALSVVAPLGAHAETIRILINQSPWLNGFVAMVDAYEEQSEHTIELDVTPFGGMVEKTRNSVRAGEGSYDIVALNSSGMAEFYNGGFLRPLTEIDPDYSVPEGVSTFGGTDRWSTETRSFDPEGTIYGVPLNGNVQVLFYRSDTYEELGLEPPETWDDLAENARAIAEATDMYGFVARGERNSILYNFTSYLFSHGGSFFASPETGDYSVTINSEQGLAALETYIALASETGPENPGAIAQAELIQLMSTGSAGQAIAVVAAYAGLNDPNSSVIAGNVGTALIPTSGDNPHFSAAGHWMAGIPANVPEESQAAAMDFLNWFLKQENQVLYVQSGGVPVRSDLAEATGDDPAFAFLPAFSKNLEGARMNMPLVEGIELRDAISLELNRALIGEISPSEALNSAAHAMHDILTRSGYDVAPPPDL